MISNRTIIGNRGSGKSISLELMMTEIATEASILLIDWPGTLADRMTGRMWERGLERRVIVDKAGWTDRMPQWPFRSESRAIDRLTRQMETQAATENLLLGLFARRHQKDGALSPNTYRAAYAAVSVYYGIPRSLRPPINRIDHLFRINDSLGRWMLSQSEDQEAARVFLDAARLSARSPQQWEYLIGAGGRLLSVLDSPAIWTRSGDSLDWQDVIHRGMHFYLGMEGLSQTTATSLAILTYAPAIQAAKELFEATGKPYPLVIVLEEAGALDLVTPLITTAMQAYRKYGVSIWAVSQTVQDFRDEATLESLLSMSEHYWHQMTAGVERAARDCANPTFDPDRVLHTRERKAIERYQDVPSRTIQIDANGTKRSESRGVSLRPVLALTVEETYDNPANHEAEFRRRLSTLRVGERVVRGIDGTVRRESVPLPADPWGPFAEEEITLDGTTQSLASHRLDAAIRRIRNSPIYLPPTQWNDLNSPPPSEPSRIPNPPTEGAPSAMRGS